MEPLMLAIMFSTEAEREDNFFYTTSTVTFTELRDHIEKKLQCRVKIYQSTDTQNAQRIKNEKSWGSVLEQREDFISLKCVPYPLTMTSSSSLVKKKKSPKTEKVLFGWKIGKVFGRGGSSVIYEVTHTTPAQTAALKLISIKKEFGFVEAKKLRTR